MDAADRYLILPRKYCDWLGGLRWSSHDDTLVDGEDKTFAFQVEIAVFLEGYGAHASLIHFGHIVHLLDLFRSPFSYRIPTITEFNRLHKAFEKCCWRWRNAGAFAATLCRDLPHVPEAVSTKEVCRRLRNPHAPIRWFVAQYNDTLAQAEVPTIDAPAFEELMAQRLAAYDTEDLEHWLCQGRGPIKQPAETLVRQIELPPPRNLPEIMAGLLQRPRLSGAAPFVGQLVSALSLPPRRLEHQEIPIGGYTDVTTRGRNDHLGDLLPSQFVLDDLEFLRRFAEHELLHFRREEPQSAVKEELVVLLDQGVRTWGDVRLVLSAAAAALTKLTTRRRIQLFFAGTSSEGKLLDPLELNTESLADFFEASDLTPNPGLALEGVLEHRSESLRDIVLLSHPRNVREEDVVAASRRAGPNDRLFAVSLDDQGRGRLSEIKHGTPLRIRDFRLDLAQVERRPDFADRPVGECPATAWTGHVEPIGFPFRFGMTDKIGQGLFDFDYAGEWLFTASPNGMIFVWSVDSRSMEVLPRGWYHECPVTQLHQLVGVAGGAAVLGSTNTNDPLLVVHYDLLHRECQVYDLRTTKSPTLLVEYFREYHTLLIRNGNQKLALDLGSGKLYPPPLQSGEPPTQVLRRTHASSRAKIVHNMDPVTGRSQEVFRHMPVVREHDSPPESGAPFIRHHSNDGCLVVNGTVPPWRSFTPRADGMPIFRSCGIHIAHYSGKTLALLTDNPIGGGLKLRLFRGPEGVALAEFPVTRRDYGFVLSHDGRRLARQTDTRQVEVRDVIDGGPALLETSIGGSHSQLEVFLGDYWIAFQVGHNEHLIRWDRDNLQIHHGQGKLSHLKEGMMEHRQSREANRRFLIKFWPYDLQRFVSACHFKVTALLDRFGQVAILDADKHLICIFFVFRHELAAWMPPDIRWGPAHLTGGPATPSAGAKIAQALCEACSRGNRIVVKP
jgi:hypothetical protein